MDTDSNPDLRPRVLFVSALQVFPPLSGGHLRSVGLARALAHHGLDVFVHSLAGRRRDYLTRRPSGNQTWPGGITEYVDRGLLGFVLHYAGYGLRLPPLWLTAYLRAASSPSGGFLLPHGLRSALRSCDVVVADFPFVSPLLGAPLARGKVKILSTHNVEHQLHDEGRTLRDRCVGRAVRRLELAAAKACDILVACSADDRLFFEQNAIVQRSLVVPNGIDITRFQGLGSMRAAARRALSLEDDETVFLFTASRWGPNRDALDELIAFARVNAVLLTTRRLHILVVGSVVPQAIRLPGLTATGRVDTVEPYFAAADAALNPTRSGAGTSLKMCEYLACRLPIITTNFGARGFRIEDGRTGFVLREGHLGTALCLVQSLLREEPARLRQMVEDAYAENVDLIDMNGCARPLVEAISDLLGPATARVTSGMRVESSRLNSRETPG